MNSWGETVQSHTDAEGAPNMRVVTASFFDEHGRVVKTHEPYYTSGAPSTSWVIVADNNLVARTRTLYDQASRVTKVESWNQTTLVASEKYAYGGDRVTVEPKAGGTTRTDFTDVRGNPTRVRLYTTAPTLTGNVVTGGTYRDTTYTHSPLGSMTGMTDAGGASWTFTFDLAGRQTAANDPDAGTSSRTYLDTGELASTTDARPVTLTHTYDALGRKTATHQDATQLSGWVYDTLSPGKLTSSTRYTPAGNYTVAVNSYNAWGLPASRTTTIPWVCCTGR